MTIKILSLRAERSEAWQSAFITMWLPLLHAMGKNPLLSVDCFGRCLIKQSIINKFAILNNKIKFKDGKMHFDDIDAEDKLNAIISFLEKILEFWKKIFPIK